MSAAITPIFLFSLPRSGSTLLQRLLCNHPSISTQPEPWVLLSLFGADREGSGSADFGFETQRRAREDFFASLPRGRADFLDAAGRMMLDLYARASEPNAEYFLDKTPRYHLICEDIREAFPSAKFIILWRNPLANLASILNVDSHWNLYKYEIDLEVGWRNLHAFQQNHPGVAVVNYENIVSNPQRVLGRLWTYLNLEPVDGAAATTTVLRGRMGDPRGGSPQSRVEDTSINLWRSSLATIPRLNYARSYLSRLGRDAIGDVGYDYDTLLSELSTIEVARPRVRDDVWRLWGLAYHHLNAGAVKGRLTRRSGSTLGGHE